MLASGRYHSRVCTKILRRPLHGLQIFQLLFPAVNCWATIVRPLCRLRNLLLWAKPPWAMLPNNFAVQLPRFGVLVQFHLVDAITQRGRVVTEPRAVATGCYIQPAIDNFARGKTCSTGLSACIRSLPLAVLKRPGFGNAAWVTGDFKLN